jgi:hypothetical protein
VNNKENRAWAKFANGVVPFLILIVKNVSNRHSVWVIEDQGGGREINAVSREVVFVLLLVVFESHPVTQTEDTMVYIHMSIQRLGAIRIRGDGCPSPSAASQPLHRKLTDSFVYRLFATRSVLSCKCAISVCLKIGVQSTRPSLD